MPLWQLQCCQIGNYDSKAAFTQTTSTSFSIEVLYCMLCYVWLNKRSVVKALSSYCDKYDKVWKSNGLHQERNLVPSAEE